MKKSILAITLLFSACSKETEIKTPDTLTANTGYATATLNGNPWDCNLVLSELTVKEGDFNVTVCIKQDGFIRQKVYVGNVNILSREYQKIYPSVRYTGRISGSTSIYETIVENIDKCRGAFSSHSSNDQYDFYVLVDSNQDNHIKIDSYDSKTKMVKGKFQITLSRELPFSNPHPQGLPDTLRFTDVSFAVIPREL